LLDNIYQGNAGGRSIKERPRKTSFRDVTEDLKELRIENREKSAG
jgi:hypothetical protein